MNTKPISIASLLVALAALWMAVENRISVESKVVRIVEARERAYCERLAKKMNEGRALMGVPPATPTNFAEVLESYFESMAMVMNQAITNSSAPKP